jgi:hypothetical protein
LDIEIAKTRPGTFDRSVKRYVIETNACCGGARLDWLDDAFVAVHDDFIDANYYAAKQFTEVYSLIRFYHVTRVEDPDFFRLNGIPLSDIDYLNERAFAIFGREDSVTTAIQDLARNEYADHNRGKVWSCLDKLELETVSGHYLKYDPEYIQAVGGKLRRKDKLRSVGIPTLIGFDVGVADLTESDLHSVVNTAIGAIFENWQGATLLANPLNFGLSFQSPISPAQIREISHPQPRGNYGY